MSNLYYFILIFIHGSNRYRQKGRKKGKKEGSREGERKKGIEVKTKGEKRGGRSIIIKGEVEKYTTV